MKEKPRSGTSSVRAGEEDLFWERATQLPIVNSAAFGYDDLDEWLAVSQGREPGHIYSRNTNPTVGAFEEKIRLLERAEAATSFATGMAAISNTFFALLSPGDRVVSIKDSFGGVLSFIVKGEFDAIRTFLPKLKYARRAANLGSVETIVGPPATTSHVECSAEERAAL